MEDGKKTNLWSTERVNAILKKWNDTGVLEKENPFWERNVNWRKPGLNYHYTPQEILEQAKVMNNILYYAETYATVLTDDGEKLVKLRPYQTRALLQFRKFKNNIYLASRQIGKCLEGHETIEIYNKANGNYRYQRLYDAYYSRKKNKNWNDKLQWWLLRQITKSKENGSNKTESLLYGIFNILVYFRYKLWNYSKEHEIIDSVLPQEDNYVNGIGENYLTAVHLRNKYKLIKIRTANSRNLTGAEDHLIYLANGTTKKLKDIKLGEKVITRSGISEIIAIKPIEKRRYCFDVTIGSGEQSFFSNGILSHNSIISGIFISWYCINNADRNVVLTSQTEDKVKDLLEKVETILKNLPFFLKPGIVYKSVLSMKFDNRVRLLACTTTENTAAGITAHLFYCDEFALIHKSFIDKFFRTVYPTMSSSKISKMIITSTPRGKNKFWQLYTDALNGLNSFNPMRTDWFEVPVKQNPDGSYEYRGDKWKNEMIADLGSEEDFNQEFGNQFVAGSDLLFSSGLLRKLKEHEVEFVDRDIQILDEQMIDYKGLLRWHPKFNFLSLQDPNAQFVTSIDLAEGTGGDYTDISIFQILPMTRMEIEKLEIFSEEKDFFKLVQIGHFRDNLTEIPQVAKLYYHLVTDVIPQEQVKGVLETNYDGKYFVSKVDGMYGEDNEMEPDHHWVKFPFQMNFETAKTFRIGIQQGEKSKMIGCKVVKDRVKYNQLVVMDKVTVEELSSMARNKRGNFEGQMKNDDSAMTTINVTHFYNTMDFSEIVSEMLEVVNPEFVKDINKKLKKEIGDDNDFDFDDIDEEDEKIRNFRENQNKPKNPFS